MSSRLGLGILVIAIGMAACSSDPQYITPPPGTSFSLEFDSGNATPLAPQIVNLPFRLETADEATERAEQAALFGQDVPFVKLQDIDLSVEWTIKNLLDCDAQATFNINGGNEYFTYDPTVFVIDPDDDE